jgi:hypothetical protein
MHFLRWRPSGGKLIRQPKQPDTNTHPIVAGNNDGERASLRLP